MMASSVIDLLDRPLVFARVAVSVSAAAARALADGQPVGVWSEDGLERLHPNGHREPAISGGDDEDSTDRP